MTTAAALVRARLGGAVLLGASVELDEEILRVDRSRLLQVLQFLKLDPDAAFDAFVDVTAIDFLLAPPRTMPTRFLLVIALRSRRFGTRLRVHVDLAEEDASYPSLTSLHPAAKRYERELFEMFGLVPEGHPRLRPFILYEGFVGHPLRKDYRAEKAQPLSPKRDDAPGVIIDGTAHSPSEHA